jgi:endonuclease IV
MPILGAHESIAGGFYKAVEIAADVGCDCVQIFTAPNKQWPKLTPELFQAGKDLTKNDMLSRVPFFAIMRHVSHSGFRAL